MSGNIAENTTATVVVVRELGAGLMVVEESMA